MGPVLMLLLLLQQLVATSAACAMRPTRLRTNNLAGNDVLSDALGVAMTSPPRLNWALESTDTAARGLVHLHAQQPVLLHGDVAAPSE